VRSAILSTAAATTLLGALAGCASQPKHLGQYADFAPIVVATKGERLPGHLTVQLARPANVVVFLVAPGRGSTLLFPEDSTQSEYMEAGAHLIETSAAQMLGDTTRIRRVPSTGRPMGARGRNGMVMNDSMPTSFGFNQHGFLLIYASQAPLPYSILKTRVAGLSLPFEDQDAINTVAKLIRERTNTTGPWAAYATDFPP
jgi:hypothetical protein